MPAAEAAASRLQLPTLAPEQEEAGDLAPGGSRSCQPWPDQSLCPGPGGVTTHNSSEFAAWQLHSLLLLAQDTACLAFPVSFGPSRRPGLPSPFPSWFWFSQDHPREQIWTSTGSMCCGHGVCSKAGPWWWKPGGRGSCLERCCPQQLGLPEAGSPGTAWQVPGSLTRTRFSGAIKVYPWQQPESISSQEPPAQTRQTVAPLPPVCCPWTPLRHVRATHSCPEHLWDLLPFHPPPPWGKATG